MHTQCRNIKRQAFRIQLEHQVLYKQTEIKLQVCCQTIMNGLEKASYTASIQIKEASNRRNINKSTDSNMKTTFIKSIYLLQYQCHQVTIPIPKAQKEANFKTYCLLSKIGLQSDSSSVHSSAAVKNGTECAQNRESQKRANIKSIEDWRNYISKQVQIRITQVPYS